MDWKHRGYWSTRLLGLCKAVLQQKKTKHLLPVGLCSRGQFNSVESILKLLQKLLEKHCENESVSHTIQSDAKQTYLIGCDSQKGQQEAGCDFKVRCCMSDAKHCCMVAPKELVWLSAEQPYCAMIHREVICWATLASKRARHKQPLIWMALSRGQSVAHWRVFHHGILS